ncbi:MAG: hypothetical protein AABY22_15670 [Nanoarchaeota archaeon]
MSDFYKRKKEFIPSEEARLIDDERVAAWDDGHNTCKLTILSILDSQKEVYKNNDLDFVKIGVLDDIMRKIEKS